jgi:hypothetical protein
MSDNIRIKTTPGNSPSSISVNVNQKFDFIEILSLKISQDEAYRSFCSDYGVVVGRVIVNNGVGVPNAKLSIFIPIDEGDAIDPEILGLYPFEIVTGKDHKGIGYNLLPKNARGKGECFTPIGTLPSKREIQDNPEMGYIYCKYYKFSTTTNSSGDFMIFGVPVGPQLIHCDVDLSDIGILSQKPYDLIAEGASENSFASSTKFKGRDETINLNQKKTTSPLSVNVVPFWGDKEQCEIGISRADIDLQTKISSNAIFMGSIISDNEKNGINRRCTPRKAMGNHSELITGPGTIEMIRKSASGRIERVSDVKIDDDGTWSYLIPMNLDYKVTAEDGTMINSDDPTKGIATRTNVRFRIGMTNTGGESRLRSRAKYLVPNNPSHASYVDYDFNESTKSESFSNLYWNKIYTIKNYITRVQPNQSVENRNFIGIKDVDEGSLSTPFPFNRIDNTPNLLINYICTFLNLFVTIICTINTTLIIILNLIIGILNIVLGAIAVTIAGITAIVCALSHPFSQSSRQQCRCNYCIAQPCSNGNCIAAIFEGILPYIPYITLSCSADPNGMNYAPCGWDNTTLPPIAQTWNATEALSQQNNGTSFHYPFDGHDGHGNPTAGWIDCMALGLMDKFNAIRFDFYNDWVNGTLYSFLYKVKIKKKGKIKFCETDCEDNLLGIDNNGDGLPDNQCRKNYVLDSCTAAPPYIWQTSNTIKVGANTKTAYQIREGYIKHYKNEYYYSAISKTTSLRLFATDIVSLGSMVDCDWQGIPNIHKYFIDTTYSKPPLLAEYDTGVDGDDITPSNPGAVDVSGYDTKIDGTNHRLIGNVFCAPQFAIIKTKKETCINVRRFSELGVGLDEDRNDIGLGYVDNKIGNNDIDNPFIRGAFVKANSNITGNIPLVYFDSATPPYELGTFGGDNDENYEQFRGLFDTNGVYNLVIHHLLQPKNSFYFYFGLLPGKSSLLKMKDKFFTECIPFNDSDFFIIGTVNAEDTEVANGQGELTIQIFSGVGPYQINWVGPVINGIQYTGTYTAYSDETQTLSNLYSGNYNVTILDSSNNVAEGNFYVPGPQPTTCNIQTTPASMNSNNDGEISINITGGQSPYTINVYLSDPATGLPLITTPEQTASISTTSHIFTNLYSGDYYVEVIDTGDPITKCNDNVEITQPSALNVTFTGNPITCYGEDDGIITSAINGGDAPYVIQWYETSNPTVIISTNYVASNLAPGTYTLTVEDNNGQTGTGTYTVTQPPETTFIVEYDDVTCFVDNGSGDNTINNGIINLTGISSVNSVTITISNSNNTVTATSSANNSSYQFTNLVADTYIITVIDDISDCEFKQIVTIGEPSSELTVTASETYHSVTAIINGSWGSAGGEYITEWEYSDNSGVSYNNTSNYTGNFINPYTNKLDLGSGNYSLVPNRLWRIKVIAKNYTHESGEGCIAYSNSVPITATY